MPASTQVMTATMVTVAKTAMSTFDVTSSSTTNEHATQTIVVMKAKEKSEVSTS